MYKMHKAIHKFVWMTSFVETEEKCDPHLIKGRYWIVHVHLLCVITVHETSTKYQLHISNALLFSQSYISLILSE